MKENYSKLLLSELISIYVYDFNNLDVKDEILKRLMFCGFDKKTIL